jgi:hypothetical protein
VDLAEDGDASPSRAPRLPSSVNAIEDGEPNLLGRYHAEGKLLTESVNLSVQAMAIIAGNDFYASYCAPLIQRMGSAIVTPTPAI